MEQDGLPMRGENIVAQQTQIIEPCYIADGVILRNCKIGPHVSIGPNTVVEDSIIEQSIIQGNTKITNASLREAMIGNHVVFDGNFTKVSLGDYTQMV